MAVNNTLNIHPLLQSGSRILVMRITMPADDQISPVCSLSLTMQSDERKNNPCIRAGRQRKSRLVYFMCFEGEWSMGFMDDDPRTW